MPEAKGPTATALAINASQTGKAFSDSGGCNLTVYGDSSSGSLTSINVTGTVSVDVKNVTLKLFEGVGWRDGRFTSGWGENRFYYRDPASFSMSTDGDKLSMTITGADTAMSARTWFSTPIDPRTYKYVIVRVMGTSNARFEVLVRDNWGKIYETAWVNAPSSYGVRAFAINSTELHILTEIWLGIHCTNDEPATVHYDFAMLSTSPSTSRNAGDGEDALSFVSGPSFSKSISWVHRNATYTISAYDEAGNELGSINYVVRRLRTHCIDMDGGNVAGATVKYFSSSLQTDADGWTDGLIFQQTNLKVNATWRGALVNETFNYNLTSLYNVLTVRCKIYNLKIIVKDLYGSPIAGSLISATLPSGITIQVTSNASGMAVFQTLPGQYKAVISYLWQTTSIQGFMPQAPTVLITFFASLFSFALTFVWIGCVVGIFIVWRIGKLPLLVSKIKESSPFKAGHIFVRASYIFVRYPRRSAHLLAVNYPIVPLLLMFVPLVSLIGLNVPAESFSLAAFLFGLAGAFLSVFYWKMLIYFKEEWRMDASKSLMSYWHHCSENKAAPFTINFIVFILATMVFMLQRNTGAAEIIAVYAFYFLVLGVAFSFLDLLKVDAPQD